MGEISIEEEVFKYLNKYATNILKDNAISKVVDIFNISFADSRKIYKKWRENWCLKEYKNVKDDEVREIKDIFEYAKTMAYAPRAKYSEKEILSVMLLRLEKFYTVSQIAKETGFKFGVVRSIISRACSYGFKMEKK